MTRWVPYTRLERQSLDLSILIDMPQSLSETAWQALIYTKFVSLSGALRPLIAELESRAATTPDELASLLAECHGAYMTTRQALMGSRVSNEIGRMNPGGSELVDLVGHSRKQQSVAEMVQRLELDVATSSRPVLTSSTCSSISSYLANRNFSL